MRSAQTKLPTTAELSCQRQTSCKCKSLYCRSKAYSKPVECMLMCSFTLCVHLPLLCLRTPHSLQSFSGTLLNLAIGCLIHSDLMFYLGLHFNSLRCRSLCLHGNDSPDCLGNSPLPACNESGQRLEQLNRRDNQSLIQTAMQNIQAIPSENVLSGILDFKLLLINLKGGGGRV